MDELDEIEMVSLIQQGRISGRSVLHHVSVMRMALVDDSDSNDLTVSQAIRLKDKLSRLVFQCLAPFVDSMALTDDFVDLWACEQCLDLVPSISTRLRTIRHTFHSDISLIDTILDFKWNDSHVVLLLNMIFDISQHMEKQQELRLQVRPRYHYVSAAFIHFRCLIITNKIRPNWQRSFPLLFVTRLAAFAFVCACWT